MYLNYRQFSVEVSEENGAFRCFYAAGGEGKQGLFLRDGSMYLMHGDKRYELTDYTERSRNISRGIDSLTGCLYYSKGPLPDLQLYFRLGAEGLTVSFMARADLHISGFFEWGAEPERSTFGVRLRDGEEALRAACGPAVAPCDNALFDRLTDRVLEYGSAGKFQVGYDWGAKAYRFDYVNGLDYGREFTLRCHENYCRDKFHLPYQPISKTHGFETPPAGWMTWYAIQFGTNEESVLANASRLAELFKAYSPQLCLWVDWEWNHRGWDSCGIPGVDSFTPNPDVYPNGLAPVAAAIEKLGLIPALWIGATNDGQLCRSYREHPEWILGDKKEWCGRYWVDPSHPGVTGEYIPAVFQNILDMGYKVVKWDCLPATLGNCDEFHGRFHDPSLTTEMAMRKVIRAARETLGPDVYMLSCSGDNERDIGFASDIFSAARIGGDVFCWDHFLASALDRVYHFYAWHNVIFYADADNLVLREELNTMAQARTRVSFYGLTGLPVTIGDDLRTLPLERCELLRRILPTADVHPMDLRHKQRTGDWSFVNLAVCREFGSWTVAAVGNLANESRPFTLDLKKDLHLPQGRYAVYDFWNQRFLGVCGDAFTVEIGALDTAALRITPVGDAPVVVGTSRHLLQGVVELKEVRFAEKTLTGVAAATVPGEAWSMTILLPEGTTFRKAEAPCPVETSVEGNLLRVTCHPATAEEFLWKLFF